MFRFVTLAVLAAVVGYTNAACQCNPTNQPCAISGVFSQYYVCDGSDTLTFDCDVGTGFISNTEINGCQSYNSPQWACLGIKYGVNNPPNCKNVNSVPQAASANSFWVCDSNNVSNLVTCPSNKPYFFANNGYLGCFTYADWQEFTGYPNCGLKKNLKKTSQKIYY
ncbi:hypothetical protein ACFFRR_006084 [Megaselia abdita]